MNYDQFAANYDARYQGDSHKGVLKALRMILSDSIPKRVLEVGCGTCHWLKGLGTTKQSSLFGVDLSFEMLKHANAPTQLLISQGIAENLPYNDDCFNLVYCVNALHHFSDLVKFIGEAFRVLQTDGVLVIIGMDPHDTRNHWYVYEFFENVLARDLDRYPAWGEIELWLHRASFTGLNRFDVEIIHAPKTSETVLQDPFLQKNGSSQMALLSQEAYQCGLKKIKSAITNDKDKGLIFSNEIVLSMQIAKKDSNRNK